MFKIQFEKIRKMTADVWAISRYGKEFVLLMAEEIKQVIINEIASAK